MRALAPHPRQPHPTPIPPARTRRCADAFLAPLRGSGSRSDGVTRRRAQGRRKSCYCPRATMPCGGGRADWWAWRCSSVGRQRRRRAWGVATRACGVAGRPPRPSPTSHHPHSHSHPSPARARPDDGNVLQLSPGLDGRARRVRGGPSMGQAGPRWTPPRAAWGEEESPPHGQRLLLSPEAAADVTRRHAPAAVSWGRVG